MPFAIVRNDITNMKVDAIVNTANPKPIIGSGTDEMIHAKAGPRLLAARQRIGAIPCGEAAITPAYGLDAKFVIHTVGPAGSTDSITKKSISAGAMKSRCIWRRSMDANPLHFH